MNEIRSIRPDEAEKFLGVLCGSFNLDPARAGSIFFTEPMFDIKRKWALFLSGEPVSILTTTPLEFGWGRAHGIAGVATRPDQRGKGLASRLLERVLEVAAESGEGPSLLFARDTRLYEKTGYSVIDRVVRAPMSASNPPEGAAHLQLPEVRAIYEEWATSDERRLRRDDQRWRYWSWHLRVCERMGRGYVCVEPGVLREIIGHPAGAVPLPAGTEWFGTELMAQTLGLPLSGQGKVELHLMGHGMPSVPMMFMTDQF